MNARKSELKLLIEALRGEDGGLSAFTAEMLRQEVWKIAEEKQRNGQSELLSAEQMQACFAAAFEPGYEYQHCRLGTVGAIVGRGDFVAASILRQPEGGGAAVGH
eukprot:SAG11_NODE_498_length_8940_cov_11.447121_1_plen_105_part_00